MKRVLQVVALLLSAVLLLLAGAGLYDLTAPPRPQPGGGPAAMPTLQVTPQSSAPQIYAA